MKQREDPSPRHRVGPWSPVILVKVGPSLAAGNTRRWEWPVEIAGQGGLQVLDDCPRTKKLPACYHHWLGGDRWTWQAQRDGPAWVKRYS